MALITKPKILFLDEPTLGLDVLARRGLWSLIRSLKGKVTVILTTHYLEEAEALSDRIAVMGKGRLKAVGTVLKLREQTGTGSLEDAEQHAHPGSGGVRVLFLFLSQSNSPYLLLYSVLRKVARNI
ncbi:hypothetical protein SDC9_55876 [bioreactor metagenome]|uniref:ATPase AAA-type core domain-containing protein n=1 Tax=bioreactor metagenome TaxID=1076179 RepID=A0A644X082_9ZZZZ